MIRSSHVQVSAAVALLLTAVSPVWAASHREAPNITELRKVDNTDVYAFVSYETGREQYVTLLSNFFPLQEPANGPNFYRLSDFVDYEIHVDVNPASQYAGRADVDLVVEAGRPELPAAAGVRIRGTTSLERWRTSVRHSACS